MEDKFQHVAGGREYNYFKVITDAIRYHYITMVHAQLHWLLIWVRVMFKTFMLMYKTGFPRSLKVLKLRPYTFKALKVLEFDLGPEKVLKKSLNLYTGT